METCLYIFTERQDLIENPPYIFICYIIFLSNKIFQKIYQNRKKWKKKADSEFPISLLTETCETSSQLLDAFTSRYKSVFEILGIFKF